MCSDLILTAPISSHYKFIFFVFQFKTRVHFIRFSMLSNNFLAYICFNVQFICIYSALSLSLINFTLQNGNVCYALSFYTCFYCIRILTIYIYGYPYLMGRKSEKYLGGALHLYLCVKCAMCNEHSIGIGAFWKYTR